MFPDDCTAPLQRWELLAYGGYETQIMSEQILESQAVVQGLRYLVTPQREGFVDLWSNSTQSSTAACYSQAFPHRLLSDSFCFPSLC